MIITNFLNWKHTNHQKLYNTL